MSFNLSFARNGFFSALMGLANRKGESEKKLVVETPLENVGFETAKKPAINRLRAVGSEAENRFVFFDRLKDELQTKQTNEDFGKVTAVNIEAVATAGGAENAGKSEKSMTRARVTSTRLTALKGYLDESA
jgi:hypothetical protein